MSDVRSQHESCPIPIGWTVRVSRMPETDETVTGIELRATHEDGYEIIDYWRRAKEEGERTVGLVRLREGVVRLTPEECERNLIAFLWKRVREQISLRESSKS